MCFDVASSVKRSASGKIDTNIGSKSYHMIRTNGHKRLVHAKKMKEKKRHVKIIMC